MHQSVEPSLQSFYFERIHLTSINKKLSLESIIIECVGVPLQFPHQLAIRFVPELVNLWTKLHR